MTKKTPTKTRRNYHLSMTRVGPARWKCDDCGKVATLEGLRKTDCPVETPPCEYCDGSEDSNECAPDCPGIAAALADPSVYLAGSGGPKQ